MCTRKGFPEATQENLKDFYSWSWLPLLEPPTKPPFNKLTKWFYLHFSTREFTLAEIEHFVDPADKSHPKFKDVAHIIVPLYPASYQLEGREIIQLTLGEAIEKVCI